jgi:signal peptidase II
LKISTNRLVPLSLSLIIVFLDRLTKQLVMSRMELHESKDFLGSLVRWTYIHNDGMIFGIELFSVRLLGYLSLIAAVVVIFVFLRIDNEPKGIRWILAAVIGGAIGNTYDRIVYAYVVDFIDVDLPNWMIDRWYVFNIADAAVSVSVCILILMLLFQKNPEREIVADIDPPDEDVDIENSDLSTEREEILNED